MGGPQGSGRAALLPRRADDPAQLLQPALLSVAYTRLGEQPQVVYVCVVLNQR